MLGRQKAEEEGQGIQGWVKVWFYIDVWKSLPDLMTFQERLGGNEETMELLGSDLGKEKQVQRS